MNKITPDQLYQFAFDAALSQKESVDCPTSYRGYVIPDSFPNGEKSSKIWAIAYKEGEEERHTYLVHGREDAERDWQD